MTLILDRDESERPARAPWVVDFQRDFRRAARTRREDDEELYSILVMRNLGRCSWRLIGRRLGISKAAVQRRHALAVEIARDVTGWGEPG